LAGIPLVDLLVDAKLASSKSEARRLIQGLGVKCDDELVTDENRKLTANDLALDYKVGGSDGNWIKLSVGKKKHALVKIK